MQHEDNLRQQRDRMQEEIIRVQEEAEARARDRVDGMEQEKASYEKRLRDKYADMVKELEARGRCGTVTRQLCRYLTASRGVFREPTFVPTL